MSDDDSTLLPAVPPALVLAPIAAPPEGMQPAGAYLAHLTTKAGQRTMRGALELAASLLSGGRSSAETLPWHLLRAEHVDALRALLLNTPSRKGEPYSPGTINKVLAAVRGVAERAWMMGAMDGEILARIRKVDGVKHTAVQTGRALSPEELRIFLTHDGSPVAVRDVAAAVLFYAGGLRRAELAALRFEHYDPRNGRLEVRQGKGHKDRTTFLLETARPVLAQWLALRGNAPGPMLCRVTGAGEITLRRMSSEAIYQRIQKRIADCGMAHASPHDFRRSVISSLLDAGVDIVTVAKMVGHASVTTTQRYDRRGERAMQKAATMLRLPGEAAPERTIPCPHCGKPVPLP